jgi:hypothetical protein
MMAHVLGGAVTGKDFSEEVIKKNNEVCGYKICGLLVLL